MKNPLFIILYLAITLLSACGLVGEELSEVEKPPMTRESKSSMNEFVFEDFLITEVTEDAIRGELIEGSGEGIYLLKSSLIEIEDAPARLYVGDEIKVSWRTDDYENEIWDDIQSIKYLK